MTDFHGGAVIGRGPMADDHYTRIHNILVRGGIKTQYVGVFGYIASHQEGWKLTAARVAKELQVGKDFISSALSAIESAGCLIRDRVRYEDGTLGGAVWFVTDLPLQLRQLGITDAEVITERVQAAYDQWRAAYEAARKPDAENPPLGLTSENASLPRSEPKSGYPALGEPAQADPQPKKSKGLKDHGVVEDQTPPPPPTPGPSAAGPMPAWAEQEEEGFPKDDNPQDPMLPLAAEVLDQVLTGTKVRSTLRPTGSKAITLRRELAKHLNAGWRQELLVEALSEPLDGVDSVYAVLLTRVRNLGPAPRRPARPAPEQRKALPAWCGMCHEVTRKATADVWDPTARPGVPQPCPHCHPEHALTGAAR
ncbi:hypothetical protein JNW90_24285 [Micromonospora sp. STR1s_5]|nr:hypothetical protein [Micromonospora sp. STR1s_5]